MIGRGVTDILTRYFLLILFGLGNLWIFYAVFTPLTVYPVFFILNLFYDALLFSGRIILINRTIPIELIEACIAGAAYYLLLILNLTTRDINLKTRVKMIVFSFVAFLIANIIRISLLAALAASGSQYFDITHRVFWYALSTIFVVAIWFTQVRMFKVKAVPFYSDIKFLLQQKDKRKRKRR